MDGNKGGPGEDGAQEENPQGIREEKAEGEAMKTVYIAGPYSADNVVDFLKNVRRGIAASVRWMRAGYAPFCPFLDFLYGLFGEMPVERYQSISMEWLRRSDHVYVLRGWEGSKGTKAEIEEAKRLGIPVLYEGEEEVGKRHEDNKQDA